MSRLELFPDSTRVEDDLLTIGGHALASLARRFGTPLYVYHRATMDAAVGSYTRALAASYPAPSSLTYAGKAFLCTAIAGWAGRLGLSVDCSSEGEIAMAAAAGLPRGQILVHGVNKSESDLRAALDRAGTIVVDHLGELERLADLASDLQAPVPHLWLRLQPGMAVATHHAHTQTGQHGGKFGMPADELLQAAACCRDRGLPLRGIHFHLGSNFRDPEPLLPAVELALDLAKEIRFEGEWHFCPGGGWGVAYHEDELPSPPIEGYVGGLCGALVEGCRARRLSLPHLQLEPGRSLIARAGVALYRVGAVKRRSGRTWLLVDGGMADNPRFAMYAARYSCLPAAGPGRERVETVSIGGPYCESGDVLIESLPMPRLEPGEWIAIPMSGAYQLSMASNYNGARRPAAVILEGGKAAILLHRESADDLLRRAPVG